MISGAFMVVTGVLVYLGITIFTSPPTYVVGYITSILVVVVGGLTVVMEALTKIVDLLFMDHK